MALTQLAGSPQRIDSFIDALQADAWSPGPSDVSYDTNTNLISAANPTFWYPRLDRFYSVALGDPGQNDFLWWDPLVIDASGPASGYIDNGTINRKTIFALGYWDKVNNTQRIYGAVNSGNNDLAEVNAAGSSFDLTELAGGWPFHPAAAGLEASTGIGSGTVGSRFFGQGEMVIFEEWGFGLLTNISVKHTDLANYDNVLAIVDLSTGLSTISTDFPVSYTSDTPHQFENPSIFGNSFVLDHIQFLPDEDSTPTAPKGQLYFSTIDTQNDLASGNNVFVYVRFNDFNPTGKSPAPGTPNRVHGRETLLSRFTVVQNTEPESGGIGDTTTHQAVTHFHVPTQRLMTFYKKPGADADYVLVTHSLAPVLDQVTEPTARQSPVEVGRTHIFEISATGDLGEPIPNLSFDWTLRRASTFEEALDTSTQPATNTVANPPIDPSGQLDVRFLGTLLTEGVDYTVNRTTGVITWAGTHSPPATAGYTVTYAHSATPVSPPHGKLLNSNSRTDLTGRAIARVQIPDDSDLEGQIDFIDRTQSAP